MLLGNLFDTVRFNDVDLCLVYAVALTYSAIANSSVILRAVFCVFLPAARFLYTLIPLLDLRESLCSIVMSVYMHFIHADFYIDCVCGLRR